LHLVIYLGTWPLYSVCLCLLHSEYAIDSAWFILFRWHLFWFLYVLIPYHHLVWLTSVVGCLSMFKEHSLTQFFTILVQDDEKVLESYAKSWTSGVLDKVLQRDSMTFTLAKHHLSGSVFQSSDSGKTLRNKLVKSLIRCYAQKRHHEVIARSCFFECLGLCNSFDV